MSFPLLKTKLFIPKTGKVIFRDQLIETLNSALYSKIILVSAPAGYGKTTLLAQWAEKCPSKTVWISLEESESDPSSFLFYLIAALQTVISHCGKSELPLLSMPGKTPVDQIIIALINTIIDYREPFTLVLDDYHLVENESTNHILSYLLYHKPENMRLVLSTRTTPGFSLSRLRAAGNLVEFKIDELRFTTDEISAFFSNQDQLLLSPEGVHEIEVRTEGWVAGLRLAVLALGKSRDSEILHSFSGTHNFVMDYLINEVFDHLPPDLQHFLLCTSLFKRFCAELCDAVVCAPAIVGTKMLQKLEQANLFLVPLDNERRWFRYHRLFSDSLQTRLKKKVAESDILKLHSKAAEWFAANDLVAEAFDHFVAAHEIDRVEWLIENRIYPDSLGNYKSILRWLASLSEEDIALRPSLLIKRASFLLLAGQKQGVSQMLDRAESVLAEEKSCAQNRDMLGRIAVTRANLALTEYQFSEVRRQAEIALTQLDSDNTTFLNAAEWALGMSLLFLGKGAAAQKAYNKSLELSKLTGNIFMTILATLGLANIFELNNELSLSCELYHQAIALSGEHLLPIIGEAYLGLARNYYHWNDLDRARQCAQQGLSLAKNFDERIDRSILFELFLVRLDMISGRIERAEIKLDEIEKNVERFNFFYRKKEVAKLRALLLLQKGHNEEALKLATGEELFVVAARAHLAMGQTTAAISLLDRALQILGDEGWPHEKLKVCLLQTVALFVHKEKERARVLFLSVLDMARKGGYIRLFLDEGGIVEQLLHDITGPHTVHDYADKIIKVFDSDHETAHFSNNVKNPFNFTVNNSLVEPLTVREIEVLKLIAQGYSNSQICDHLSLALDTVKGHNRNLFGKLQAKRRTEAVANARKLGLL